MKRTYQPAVVRRKRIMGLLSGKAVKSAGVRGSTQRLGIRFANSIGQAAAEQLEAGYPIYCYDERYPEGVVRKYPDGRKELVRMRLGKVDVIRSL